MFKPVSPFDLLLYLTKDHGRKAKAIKIENVLLFVQFKAWNVFQTHIKHDRTVGSHPWPSWCRVQTLWECQLLKFTPMSHKHCLYKLNEPFFVLFIWSANRVDKKREIFLLVLECRVGASHLLSCSEYLHQVL